MSSGPTTSGTIPCRRADLVIKPIGDDGGHVVKDGRTGTFFSIGPHETFLLERLDGKSPVETICEAFEEQFSEPLSNEDLHEFISLAAARGLLVATQGVTAPTTTDPAFVAIEAASKPTHPKHATSGVRQQNSLLFWRRGLFNPDRLFEWLEPKVRFFWTEAFMVVSLASILGATLLVGMHGQEIMSYFATVLRWEVFLIATLTLLTVTMLHESAHGLTCKHYGGQVGEIGFLLLFFLPALYCNVSDSWLFKEKWKRLAVMLAGGYFELFLWSLAVFVWRATPQDTLVNYAAWIVLTISGARVFFNFNPLLKLDGYYIVSDLLEVPNLRDRSLRRFGQTIRWILWGAKRPDPEPRARLLFWFGAASWLFSIGILATLFVAFWHLAVAAIGPIGGAFILVLAAFTFRRLFGIFGRGDVRAMLGRRSRRTAVWAVLVLGIGCMLWLVPVQDRATGSFSLHPVKRVEVRAPVTAFLQSVAVQEGDVLCAGDAIAKLEIPDLQSQIAQKRAELNEVQARLTLLEAGTRPEEIREQRNLVQHAQARLEDAKRKLAGPEQRELEEDLARLGARVIELKAEVEYAVAMLTNARSLFEKGNLSKVELLEAQRLQQVTHAQRDQAIAEQNARRALGTRQAEQLVTLREKELVQEESKLSLMEAGARPEEIDAERARLQRLKEELNYLKRLEEKLDVCSDLNGRINTPRLTEKVGQHFLEGDLICVVEDISRLAVEILVPEQYVARVEPGQSVRLKPRALPFKELETIVDAIAPGAEVQGPNEQPTALLHPGHVRVVCWIDNPSQKLRAGLTGYARIYTGRRRLGGFLADRVLRYLRTEFWW